MTTPVTHDDVRALTSVADLPLDDDRVAAVAELLSAWLPAANLLAEKMAATENLGVSPITVIIHPTNHEGQ